MPKALVTVTAKKLVALDARALAGTLHPYPVARIGGRLFGRSRLFPMIGPSSRKEKARAPFTSSRKVISTSPRAKILCVATPGRRTPGQSLA